MDFLDPKKERRSRIQLVVGYVLVSIAIGMGAFWLLFLSYGWTKNKEGNIVQNGLLFVSSQPSDAAIYLDGQRYKSNTNSRVLVAAGSYTLQITKQNYRIWQRTVTVAGDDVQHFDYPFLWPQKLRTTSLADLDTDPSLATQSLDRRWVVTAEPGTSGTFTLWDMKHPDKPVQSQLTLPTGSFTAGTGAQTWSTEEWAADNKHVVLLHTYATAASATNREYILLDRTAPDTTVNLTKSLSLGKTATLNLFDNRTSQFYVYDPADLTLRRVDANGSAVSTLQHVLAYKTYGSDKILYITDTSPTGKSEDGKVSAVLQDGQETVTLRSLPAAGNGTYVLNLADYAGDWYVAVGSTTGDAVYVYKNPQAAAPSTRADVYPTPWRHLAIVNPSYLTFSGNTQFLLAESGQQFVVYDLENLVSYSYTASQPIDTPQKHATWMDGDRLLYVSGGKLTVFDYDYKNQQTLIDANASYLPFFAPDYTYLYTVRPDSGDGSAKPGLGSTPLTVKQQ